MMKRILLLNLLLFVNIALYCQMTGMLLTNDLIRETDVVTHDKFIIINNDVKNKAVISPYNSSNYVIARSNSSVVQNYKNFNGFLSIGGDFVELTSLDEIAKSESVDNYNETLSGNVTANLMSDNSINELLVYPNPFYDRIKISSDYTIEQIKVFSANSNMIFNKNYEHEKAIYIDLVHLLSGFYYCQIITSDIIVTKLITKL